MVAITAAQTITIRVTGQGVQGPPGPAGIPGVHAPTHSRVGLGGTDSITVENLATSGAVGSVPTSDGAGALAMTVPGNVTSPGGETAGNLMEATGSNAIAETSVTTASVSGHLASTANPHSVTAAQAGADPAGTATAAVSEHDALTSAHAALPVENLAATSTNAAFVFAPDGANGVVARAEAGGVTDHGALTGLLDDDHTQYQLRSEKNAVSGYPGLDGSSKLTGSQQVYGATANTAVEGDDSRVPIQGENDALVGTDGTPATGNPYVTDSDPRNTDARPPSGTAAGDLGGTYPNPTVNDGADSTAIHRNVNSEFGTITDDPTPPGDGRLIAETAAGVKFRVDIGNLPTGGGGESNDLVNAGTGITMVATPSKVGINLQARSVSAGSSKVSITEDAPNENNAFDVVEANIVHQNLSGAGTTDHAAIDAHIGNTATTAPHTNPMLALRTGARAGGFVTIVTGTTFSVSDGDGFVVDNATTPGVPVVTSVSWSGITGITATQIGTSEFTVISIDSTGSLVQGTSLGPVDRRDKIVLAIIGHNAATLTNVEQISSVIYEQDLAFADFMGVLGLVNADGNDYTRATVAALGLDVTSGSMYFPGINNNDTAANRRSPNLKPQTGATDISWTYIRGDGSGGITVDATGVTDINVTQRDDGAGGLTALTGNGYKVDLIFRHSDGGTVVQFGSIQFASLSDAVNAAITTADPLLDTDFIFRFALVVKRNTTDLNTATDAQFIEVIGVSGSGSSSIGGGDVLGPAGGTVLDEVTVFADATGKVIQGSGGLLSANLAVLDGSRLFSSAIVQAAIPEWSVRETGVAADSGNWAVRADGTTFRVSAVDDALTGVTDAFTITRTGATPSVVEALTNFVASATAKVSQSVDDTTVILTLSNAGTNGADIEVLAGDRNPEGLVTASPGALYIRANGINSAMYQLDAAASANTPWVELGAGAAPSGVAEIQVGLDSLTAAVPIGGTPTSVAMDFSAVTFDTSVYSFSVSDTDVTINTTGRYQMIMDGSIQSTAVGDSQILAEIFKTGVPVTNAQMQVTVDNSTVTRNGFTVTRIIDLSAGDVVGPRFTQTAGSGSSSVSPGSLRFSLVFYSASVAGAVGRKATWGLVTTAPHAIDTDSGTPFKADGSGAVRELEAVAQLDTDVAGGTFTFDVKHGPDAGPFVSIGTVSITQGNRSGSFVPGAPVAFAAGDIFVIDRTAIGAFPGGTAEDKQRITVQLHVDLD